MNLKTKFDEKLSKLLFLEVSEEKIYNIFNVKLDDSIYLPVKSINIIKKVRNDEQFETIPLSYFVEGMFYVLGGDKNFTYNSYYIKVLQSNKLYIKFIKGIIFDEIKETNYEEAYMLLKGLVIIESNVENYDKLLLLVDDLRVKNKEFEEEELEVISEAKKINNYTSPFLYEALVFKDQKRYSKALNSLNEYIKLGGKETSDINKTKLYLEQICDFEEGKDLAVKDSEKSLKLLIPLKDKYSESYELYYYIAVAYRTLGNYEKAIFYLNEAIYINKDLIEAFNELGLNYACIGDFKRAIQYFRKVFEVTKAIEVCTNLIMCYLNLGDINQAQLHIKIAEKLDPNDKVLLELKDTINKSL